MTVPDPSPILNEHPIYGADRNARPTDPRQFSLSDMFAMVTLAALMFAMAAPLLREMQPESTPRLLAVAGVQLLIVAGAILLATSKRRKLLERSGRRIGVAYCGEARWRHWPLAKSWLAMIALAAIQLFLALMYATDPDDHLLSFLMFRLQLGCFAGFAFSRYLWRAYPSMLEFFDNGVSIGGITFFPWAQVDVRDSRLFDDRIVVVLRPAPHSVAADTRVAQVSAVLRKAVFATAGARPKPADDDSQ